MRIRSRALRSTPSPFRLDCRIRAMPKHNDTTQLPNMLPYKNKIPRNVGAQCELSSLLFPKIYRRI
jgi:hypothetical protein